MHIQFQLAQQCIQISTRINSSSVHTYIFVCSTLRVILQGFVTQNATDMIIVTVINSSSSDDENYSGLLECACKLVGETSDKSSIEGGIQGGVKPGVESGVSNMLIPKMSNTGLLLSNDMASSLSQSEQSNDVSFIHY